MAMSKTAITIALAGALAFSSGVARAQEGQEKTNLLAGKRLFNAYCSLCHGENGRGHGPLASKLTLKRPVADLTADKYQSRSVDDLTRLVQGYSRDNSQMPKWENAIPERNLRQVAAYVLALTQTDLRLRGDARRGKEIFRQSCVACHGPGGQGNGVLAQLLAVKMIDYTTKALAQVSDQELIDTITKGRGQFMPAWTGTLSSEEIKDVAAYVRTLYQQ